MGGSAGVVQLMIPAAGLMGGAMALVPFAETMPQFLTLVSSWTLAGIHIYLVYIYLVYICLAGPLQVLGGCCSGGFKGCIQVRCWQLGLQHTSLSWPMKKTAVRAYKCMTG